MTEDRPEVTPAPALTGWDEQLQALLDDEDEVFATADIPLAPNKKLYGTQRSVEEQAVVDAQKAAGLLPDGKKRRSKRTATVRDAHYLAFLAQFRVATAETLSQLQTVDDPTHRNHGKLIEAKSVTRRMESLEQMGLVTSVRIPGFPPVYSATQNGKDVAIARGLLGLHEVDPKTWRAMKTGNLPHFLAVSHIASQLISPKPLLLKNISRRDLISEYQAQSFFSTQVDKIKKNAGEAGHVRDWGQWRTERITDARAEAKRGDYPWSRLVGFQPGIWVPGQTNQYLNMPREEKDFFNEWHMPDLIVNKERVRKDEKPVSYMIEVELSTNKQDFEYRKMFRTLAAEFRSWTNGPPPTVYRKMIFFTNSQAVANTLHDLDKQYGLIEGGFLLIKPITKMDGKTPHPDYKSIY